MKMSHQLKIAVCVLALSCSSIFSSFAVFDIDQAIDEVATDPLTAYTVYLGMPKRDFGVDFSVLPDWKYSSVNEYTEKAERSMVIKNSSVLEGVDIVAAGKDSTARVIQFNNYFKTPNKGLSKDLFNRAVSTVWMTMEMPLKQTDDYVFWVSGDVTILITRSYDKSANTYVVNIRRFNNHVLNLAAMLKDFNLD